MKHLLACVYCCLPLSVHTKQISVLKGPGKSKNSRRICTNLLKFLFNNACQTWSYSHWRIQVCICIQILTTLISYYNLPLPFSQSSLYTLSGRTACICRTINKVWPAGGKSLVVGMQRYCRKNVCVTLESRVATEGSRSVNCLHILIFPKNCKIQYRKVFKNTVHWNPVGLGCIAMPPCWLCCLHLCLHARLLYTQTHMHSAYQYPPQQPCRPFTKPCLESLNAWVWKYHLTFLTVRTKNSLKKVIFFYYSNTIFFFLGGGYIFTLKQSSVFILSHANLSWALRPWPCLTQLCGQQVKRTTQIWFGSSTIKNKVRRPGMKTICILLPYLKT